MTRDDEIIKLAKEAGLGTSLTHNNGVLRVWIEGADWHDELEHFAALVAAAEREACAMEADYEAARWSYAPECREPCEEIAKAIRARGKE